MQSFIPSRPRRPACCTITTCQRQNPSHRAMPLSILLLWRNQGSAILEGGSQVRVRHSVAPGFRGFRQHRQDAPRPHEGSDGLAAGGAGVLRKQRPISFVTRTPGVMPRAISFRSRWSGQRQGFVQHAGKVLQPDERPTLVDAVPVRHGVIHAGDCRIPESLPPVSQRLETGMEAD